MQFIGNLKNTKITQINNKKLTVKIKSNKWKLNRNILNI